MESMMSRKLLSLSVSAMALAGAAQADAPRVATDIAPVHALVARVMDGVGAPDLIIQKGASPHAYNLRPSEAGALQEAEILFWIGPDLTPWMEDAAETLAGDAQIVTLLDLPETTRLEFREGALFEAHAHEGEHGHDHEHEAGHDHDHDHAKADHDHEHDHEHEHEHEHERVMTMIMITKGTSMTTTPMPMETTIPMRGSRPRTRQPGSMPLPRPCRRPTRKTPRPMPPMRAPERRSLMR
jgi:ABC-type Zn2+ transport system substrate-binding protein/surface adhesin